MFPNLISAVDTANLSGFSPPGLWALEIKGEGKVERTICLGKTALDLSSHFVMMTLTQLLVSSVDSQILPEVFLQGLLF